MVETSAPRIITGVPPETVSFVGHGASAPLPTLPQAIDCWLGEPMRAQQRLARTRAFISRYSILV
jgi:hypothetical protein